MIFYELPCGKNWRLRGLAQRLKQLDSDLVMAWILSETINLFDIPYTAGFREPVLYTFEKAVAIPLDQLRTYIRETGIKNITIDKELELMHRISDVRDELAMIGSVIVQQQRVWNDFSRDHFKKNAKSASEGKPPSDSEDSGETEDWWERTDSWQGLNLEAKLWLERTVVLRRPKSQLLTFLSRIDKIDEDAQRQ